MAPACSQAFRHNAVGTSERECVFNTAAPGASFVFKHAAIRERLRPAGQRSLGQGVLPDFLAVALRY